MNNNLIELNRANFEREVLRARNPVLVQFWAAWSEPSMAMMPLLESIAEDNDIPVRFGRVNVERDRDLAQEYGVQCVPTLLIFNQGALQDQLVGRATERELHQKLKGFK